MKSLWFGFLLLTAQMGVCQSLLQKVAGLPTNELYDLLTDRNGYLWVGHGLGLSRFDGLQFIHYSHPAQINLRTTDLLEDSQGRIWFHNFSGQVFYHQKGKIHLLESYPYKSENQTPKMVLSGNEIVISSYKGVFVCNTLTLATRFLAFDQTAATSQVSMTVLKEKVVIYNNIDWYVYEKGNLQKIIENFSHLLPTNNLVSLNRSAYNDTLFVIANPSGILYKLMLRSKKLYLLAQEDYRDYINNISVDKDAWVHTRNKSVNLASGQVLTNTDLNVVLTGKDGHTWFGSRREGLLVSYRPSLCQQISFAIKEDDYIRALNANAGYFFAGTQEGTLYRFATDSSTADWKLELFNGLGSIDFIRYVNHDLFIVGSSTNTYIVDAAKSKILTSLPVKNILDVDFDGSSFYIATSAGIYVVPYLSDSSHKKAWVQTKKKQFPFYNWEKQPAEIYHLFPQRTASIRFDLLRNHIYAATKNGLLEITKRGAHPYRINGAEIFASAVAFKKSRLYVATINNGLWEIEGQKTKHYTAANTLASNTIIRLKLTEDHLWLFENNGVQVLNIHTGQLLANIDLPTLPGAHLLDVTEKSNTGYLATINGVYKVPLNVSRTKINPSGFLDYVVINGRDTALQEGISVSHRKNDIQFYFSSPAYDDPASVSFRYRLLGAEEAWQATLPGERTLRYPALPPGHYTFELFAVNSTGEQQQNTIRYAFTILKPWWQSIWFILAANLLAIAAVYAFAKSRIQQKLRLEQIRRTIASDLHDDIGATLSSVNLYINLAQKEKENTAYLRHIKENVNQVINNLDDLVWSINPKNDTTGQFIQRLQDYAIPLLEAAGIHCHFTYDGALYHLKINLLTKRHLYLIFKEVVNNVAKHSAGQNCYIELTGKNNSLLLTIRDDGKGFDSENPPRTRNGLSNIIERTQKLKGHLVVRSQKAKGSMWSLTIPV